jgi:hypothetical protein
MANGNATNKLLIPFILTAALTIAGGAWGIYETAGNGQHGAMEKRLDKVETALEKITLIDSRLSSIETTLKFLVEGKIR